LSKGRFHGHPRTLSDRIGNETEDHFPQAKERFVAHENKRASRQDMTDSTDSLNHTFIILGLTKEGRKFRPSDWAERLCGVMSAFGAEKKMKYSPYVGPGDYSGEKAVFVDGRLHEVEPMAYRFLLNFAGDNDLQVVSGVCPIEPKA